MKSITLHGLDDKLSKAIRKKAAEENKSLNKVIKQLLAKALGLEKDITESRRKEFECFLGSWSKDDLEEFNNNTKDLNTVDEDDWK